MTANQVSKLDAKQMNRRRSMLAPVAYSESVMPVLRLTQSSQIAHRIAWTLFIALIITIVFIAFAPWQQTVNGSGNVLAFSPTQRMQIIEAPVKGRIVRWGDDIFENARVSKGQFIVEIEDLDSDLPERLQLQLQNAEQAVESARAQLSADQRALEEAKLIVKSYRNNVSANENIKVETILAQDAFVQMARRKVMAEQQQLEEYKAAVPQIQAEYDRAKILQAEGNFSLQKFQEVERKLFEAQAKVKRAQAYVESAESELEGKIRERSAKIEKAQVDIDKSQADVDKALVDVSKAESSINKTKQDLNKAEKEVLEQQTKVSRQGNQIVYAPMDGYLTQITPNIGTSITKEGTPLATIVPDTMDRSVQIWLNGNDAPLVEPGRHVRLQFEGWPALQFAGWPSIAVGTFGGEVISVDATDDGKGRFRVLVGPSHDSEPWPQDRFLRQGVRANGWILLDQVPMWFEIWRRLNGFPPVVSIDEPEYKGDKPKPPKLPK